MFSDFEGRERVCFIIGKKGKGQVTHIEAFQFALVALPRRRSRERDYSGGYPF